MPKSSWGDRQFNIVGFSQDFQRSPDIENLTYDANQGEELIYVKTTILEKNDLGINVSSLTIYRVIKKLQPPKRVFTLIFQGY